MRPETLASCQILPQQVSILIEGGVHVDGFALVAIFLIVVLIRKKR